MASPHEDEDLELGEGDEIVEVLEDDDDLPMDEDDDMDGDGEEGVEVTEEVAMDEGEEEQGPVQDDSVRVFLEHHDSVYACDLSPTNPDLAVTGGGDDRALLWRISTGEVVYILGGHTDSVSAVAFSRDGKLVAVGGMDGRVNVWDVETGELSASLEGPDEVVCVAWHPKGNLVLAGSNDGSAWLWGSKGTLMNVYAGEHSQPITAACFTPDGKHIVTISEDGKFILWDPKTAQRVFRMSSDEDGRYHEGGLLSLAVNPESTIALTGGVDHRAVLLHLATGKILATFENHSDSLEAVGFASTLHLAATGGMDGKLCIWDLNTNRIRHVLQHADGVTRLAWHATEPIVYSGSIDKTIRVWDARSGECLKTLQGHRRELLDMAISRDGRTILSCDDDGARVFRL